MEAERTSVAQNSLVEVDRRFKGAFTLNQNYSFWWTEYAETSVYFHETTRRYISECCRLHTNPVNILASHLFKIFILTVFFRQRLDITS
jgi:hypothetical protein